MPVWRLLRVHCGGAASVNDPNEDERLLERDADFEAGQVGTEAEVDAMTEREVRVGITAQLERVRVRETAGVPVGGSLPDHDLLARPDHVTTELARGGRRPPFGRRRCRPAEDLLDGPVDRDPPGPEQVELRGPLHEGEHRTGDGVAGRLGPAEKSSEKKAESSSSLSRGGCSSGSSAWTTAESMSWAGLARFSSISAVPYSYIRSTAACRRGLMDKKSDSSGMSKMCSTASKRRWRSASGTPSSRQMACIGSSAATSTRKSHSSSTDASSTPHPAPQLLLQAAHDGRGQALGDEATDARVPWVVHHVEDDAGHREVLNDRPAVGPIAAGLGREGDGVVQDPEHLVVGGDRPEPLAVGGVGRGLVPPDGCQLPVQAEDVVGEAAGERVEVGEIDLPEVLDHRAILPAPSAWVKNGAPGA